MIVLVIIKLTTKLVTTTKVVNHYLLAVAYLPSISVSILTLSPIFLELRFVVSIVCGMMHTEILFFITSTSVKLIPSIAIDPFLTTYFVRSFVSSIQSLISFGNFSTTGFFCWIDWSG